MAISISRKGGDIIVIKIYDDAKNCCYKDRANIMDKKQLGRIFLNLQEKFGIDFAKLVSDYVDDLKEKEIKVASKRFWE